MVRFGVLTALIFVRLMTPPVCFCHCHAEECSHKGSSHPHVHAFQFPFLNHDDDDETDGNCPASDAVEVSDDFYLGTVTSESAKIASLDLPMAVSIDTPFCVPDSNATAIHPHHHDPGSSLTLACLTSVQVLL